MPIGHPRPDIDRDILEAFDGGYTYAQVAELVGLDKNNFANRLHRLCKFKKLVKVGWMQYMSATKYNERGQLSFKNGKLVPTPALQLESNGNATDHGLPPREPTPLPPLVESDSRKVELPSLIQEKQGVKVFIERSPVELDEVCMVELKIANFWIPIQLNGDTRICIGEAMPLLTSSQVTYHEVTAYRVTFANGRQYDYAHDPRFPVTVALRLFA